MEAEAWIFLQERVSVQWFLQIPAAVKEMSWLYRWYREPEKSYEQVNQQEALRVVVLEVGNLVTGQHH
jgi:hypothetical protein